nr:IS3 family transposase [Desulfobulbus rhabdoformis]
MSIRRQCKLLDVPRSVVYYKPKKESAANQLLMELIDKFHLQDPAAGTRRISKVLRRYTQKCIGRKRVRRLMGRMGIEAIYPRKRTTIPGGPSGIFPYRLKGLKIDRPNQVWCADISYIPMYRGHMYLFAVMDWYSRKIIDWELSTTLDTAFCLKCLNRALLTFGSPEIMNTDQGCQFTSEAWINALIEGDVTISMDGKGRWVDNVMIERFWRSIKYEDIYLKSYETPRELGKGIRSYVLRYNIQRPHSSLSDMTPEEMYCKNTKEAA